MKAGPGADANESPHPKSGVNRYIHALRHFHPRRVTFSSEPGDDEQGGLREMGIGVSLILIAVGAILTWAVNATVSGLDINTIGVILMVVGAIGLVLSLLFWSSWGGAGAPRRRTTYVDDGPPPGY
jgi:hypothetical protein